MRVFLDTKVLASAVATRGICADILQVALSEHDLVLSEQVLSELRRALRRKFRVEATIADEVDEFLRREAEVIADAPKLHIAVRDEDDKRILEQAVAAAAHVLVSGDRDLTGVVDPPLPILTPRGLWDLLRETPAESQ
ncbi:MAG: putative toxin-antitoxin system toxin component, PIN family [Gemmatimonadota bacterium]